MKLTRALFASLLSAALLGVAVAADIHRRHQHTSRYTNDNTTILTNGERLARGLPPKPPTRRWASGTKTTRDASPSNFPGTDIPPVTGRLRVQSTENPDDFGFVANVLSEGGRHWVTNQDFSRNIEVGTVAEDIGGATSSLFYGDWVRVPTGASRPWAYAGVISPDTFKPTAGSLLSFGSCDYTAPGASASLGGTSLPSPAVAPHEALVWHIDGTSAPSRSPRAITASWVNSGGSSISLYWRMHTVTKELFLVTDPTRFLPPPPVEATTYRRRSPVQTRTQTAGPEPTTEPSGGSINYTDEALYQAVNVHLDSSPDQR